jgi:glycosyltransferase involved in cell wall biosynthesis
MHICRITRGFVPLRDGFSHHTYYLSKHQAALGHRVWVLQPQHAAGELDGFAVYRLPLASLIAKYGRYKSVKALFAFLAGVAAVRLHKTSHLDLIHAHGDIIDAFILRPFARALGIPLVMTIHSGLNSRQLYRKISAPIWRMMDGLIAVSQDIASDIQRFGVHSDHLTVISSGVELDHFMPMTAESRRQTRLALGIPEAACVITSVGRLTPMKGTKYLIAAIQRLKGMADMQCYLIGSGPLQAELAAMAAGVSQIHLVGSQPHDRICSYLHATDVFVLPSIDLPGETEGTPTAVIEAMAIGLPVITTDSGGAQHLITAIKGLTLVPQRDSCALADAMAQLVRDAAARQRIGALNRERVASRDWPHIAAAVCRFYESVSKST